MVFLWSTIISRYYSFSLRVFIILKSSSPMLWLDLFFIKEGAYLHFFYSNLFFLSFLYYYLFPLSLLLSNIFFYVLAKGIGLKVVRRLLTDLLWPIAFCFRRGLLLISDYDGCLIASVSDFSILFDHLFSSSSGLVFLSCGLSIVFCIYWDVHVDWSAWWA